MIFVTYVIWFRVRKMEKAKHMTFSKPQIEVEYVEN